MSSTDAGALAASYTTFGAGTTFGTSTLAHIARLGAELGIMTRTLLWATMFSLALSMLTSAVYTMVLAYDFGAYNFNVYTFKGGSRAIYNTVVSMQRSPFDGPDWKRMGFFAIGAVGNITLQRGPQHECPPSLVEGAYIHQHATYIGMHYNRVGLFVG